MKSRLIYLLALAFVAATMPVLAESLGLGPLNLNIGNGNVNANAFGHAHVNVSLPASVPNLSVPNVLPPGNPHFVPQVPVNLPNVNVNVPNVNVPNVHVQNVRLPNLHAPNAHITPPLTNINVNSVRDVDALSALRNNPELRRIVLHPATKEERKLGQRLLKTAAALLTIRGADGLPPNQQPQPPDAQPPSEPVAVNSAPAPQSEQTSEQTNAAVLPVPTQTAVAPTVNTFDQTRPLLFKPAPVKRQSRRSQIAQIPAGVVPPPAAAVHHNGSLPSGTRVNEQGRNAAAPLMAPSTVPGAHTRSGAVSHGGATSAVPETGTPLEAIHSNLKKVVQAHPSLTIFLIALFAIMLGTISAMAIGLLRSHATVRRLNRGLEAKVAELNELNEELVRTRDKAIEGSRLKSEFVANISHEIRTPITAVLGMIGLLKDTPGNARQVELVKVLDESAKSLLTVINDILDFSKIEAGMLVIQSVDFKIETVVSDVIEMFAASAAEKSLNLALDLDPDADIVVNGDPFRLRQVLLNLIGNAIKFTESGEVKLRIEPAGNNPNSILFRVSDTGIGISEDSKSRLFQPFTQADGTTTRRFGGTGLGLSITKRLVELMGGTIQFASEKDQGSEFWFTIPFEAAGSEPLAAPEPPVVAPIAHKAAGHRRILVAEDSPVLQRIVLHQLKTLDYDVVAVKNGIEAIDAIKSGQFDLVLMDWQMPELDGIQATKEIRMLGAAVPIIAMTANAMEGDRLSCLNAGMNDYISKPFTVEQLQKMIETWLPIKTTPES